MGQSSDGHGAPPIRIDDGDQTAQGGASMFVRMLLRHGWIPAGIALVITVVACKPSDLASLIESDAANPASSELDVSPSESNDPQEEDFANPKDTVPVRTSPNRSTPSLGQSAGPSLAPAPMHEGSGQPLRLGTFNIQDFGTSKADNPEVMEWLATIGCWFDVLAIQEVSSKNRDVVGELVDQMNQLAAQQSGQQGNHFAYVLSDRVGEGRGSEQYAFLWNTQRIEAFEGSFFLVTDQLKRMNREPFIGSFRVRDSRDRGMSMTLINVHTDPDEAVQEIGVLADVFRNVRQANPSEDDVILLGDMNAERRQLGSLQQIPGVDTVCDGFPTTKAKSGRTIDHIVIDRYSTTEFLGHVGPLRFIEDLNVRSALADKISDHFPVWALFEPLEHRAYNAVADAPLEERR
jgi:deoxyribonuclease-1-like protein